MKRKKLKIVTKKLINNKYGKQNDPLCGKKGQNEDKLLKTIENNINKPQLLKNKNDTPNSADGMPSNEMIESMMNKLKESGKDPEEVMKQLNNPDYPEELKRKIVQDIFK